ncbi:PAS domain S-box protein [Dyadobacter sp. CY345]|uniref:PAS domain S-box protein n=1 Tax=Dyadobacter sp. CY345 TaxID=2909335 RepID=UPI001F3222BF|nr:PAS domain S-box protein [Dyadobacter sp. CY345]MCF2443395.1 PAS domain S-box protein [Dyadobacter sp. CY345]
MDMIQVFETVWNDQGEIIDFKWILNNYAAEKVYGNVIGLSLLQQQPGVVQEGIFEAFRQVVETGEPQQYEKHYLHEQFNGWFRQSVVKLNGGVAITTSDITSLKNTEQQLRESRTILQSVIDASKTGVAVYKAVRNDVGEITDFVHEYINRASIDMLGEDFTGKRFSDLGENALVQMPQFRQVIEAGKSSAYVRQTDFQGSKVWFSITDNPLDGDRLVHTWEDITKEKKAEAEMLLLKDKIAKIATDKFESIFNAIDDGFCIYKLIYNDQEKLVDLEWVEVNPAYEEQTGLRDVIGKRHSDFSFNTEDYWYETYEKVSETGEPTRFEQWHQPTGRWYLTNTTRIGGTGSRQVAVVFSDITESKQLAQQQIFLLKLTDALRSIKDPVRIQQGAVKLIAKELDVIQAFYFEMLTDGDTFELTARYEVNGSPVPDRVRISDLPANQAADYRNRRTFILCDSELEEHRESYRALGIRAVLGVPLVKNGQLMALVAVYSELPRNWTKFEIELVEESARRTWAAVEGGKAEEAVKDSKERFQSIANLVPDLLWDSEPDGSTNWYNMRWLEYTGQTLEEAIGWGWVDAIHPEDREGSAQRYGKAVETGQPLQQEHRIQRHDGVYRWFVVSSSPVKDESGKVVKMYGAATDIHDRRQAEDSLRESEEKFRTLFETIDEGFCIQELLLDKDGRVVDMIYREANEAFEQHTGLTEASGKQASEVFPNIEHSWFDALTRVYQTGISERIEGYNEDTGRWLTAQYSRFGGAGSPFVVAVFNDFTERKQREINREFQINMAEDLSHITDEDEIVKIVGAKLAAHLALTSYHYVDIDEDHSEVTFSHAWSALDVLDVRGTYPLYAIIAPDAMDGWRAAAVAVINDIEHDLSGHTTQSTVLKEGAWAQKVAAYIAVPFSQGGQWKAYFSVSDSRARKWTALEIELVQAVAGQLLLSVERARAEASLRDSEEKLRTVFDSMDQGFCIIEIVHDHSINDGQAISAPGVDYRLLEANGVFERQTGVDNARGKLASEYVPAEEPFWLENFDQVARTGEPVRLEHYHQVTSHWYSALVVRIGDQGSNRVAIVFDDITGRKHQEQRQAYMLELSDAFRTLSNPLAIEDKSLRLLRNQLNVPRAVYAEALDQEGKMQITAESLEEGLLPTKGAIMHFSDFTPEAFAEALQGRPLWQEDVQEDDYSAEHCAGYAELNTRSWLMVPFVQEGRLVAGITIHHSEPRMWKPDEIQLVQEVIERTWLAVDRANTEQQVHNSEKRLRIATKAADMATWEWDLVQNQVIWNERHFEIFGLEPRNEPVQPQVFFEHIHPADRERVDGLLRESLASDVEFDTEFRAVLEDGSERWMSGFGRVMERSGTEPVSMSGVMFDITARRQAQQDLHRSEERQSAILESAKDYAILTLDMDLRVRDWNAGAQNMMGYLEEEIVGQPGEIFFVPEDRAKGAPQLEKERAVNEGRATNERWHLRKDGSRFYGSGVTTPLLDDADNIIGLLKVMRDLTLEKRSEDALKEGSKRKDEFLAMLAHELRNPVSTVRNGISLLKFMQQADPQVFEIVNMMDNQATHLVRMIDDLLDVSRVTQGKIELKSERMEIGTLIQNTVKAIQPQYESRGKTLRLDEVPTDLFIQGDPTRLSQVMTNLLTNSLRYTGDDGKVWVSLAAENNEAVIRVKDNGIGLSTEQQTSVFELFVQADNSLARTQGGLGIGLTLVRQLVEMHNGRVQAISPGIGQGSQFTVYLPLMNAPQQTIRERSDDSTNHSTLQILIIDDIEDLAKMTSMLLKLKGYKVDIRFNGKAGAEAVETLEPAVVLCDIGMPDLDGYKTARLIRQGNWGRNVTLIALSGYGQQEDKQRSKEAGFDGHLIKPVNMEELQKLINNLMTK